MPYPTTVVEALISSPSDVTDARDLIEQVISDWNIANSRASRLTVVSVRWETHAVPEAGADPQAILNRQLVQRSDLLVAVFGGRLGTRTPRGLSGTAEEIEEFIRTGKPVMPYVVADKRRQPEVDSQQLRELDIYLTTLRSRALLKEVETVTDLGREFNRHLPQAVQPFMSTTGVRRVAPPILDKAALKTLALLFECNGRALVEAIADGLGVRDPTAEFHLDRLQELGLVQGHAVTADGQYFELTQEGREELHARGLLI